MRITHKLKSYISNLPISYVQAGLILLSLLAIALHILFNQTKIVVVNTVAADEVLLLIVILLGGVPLCWQIFPHETAAVDGQVIEGQGMMDESYLTGEPYHQSKTRGSAILSGAINGESVLVMRAEKRAKDSRHTQIMQVMQQAEQKRPAMRLLLLSLHCSYGR